MLHPNAFAALQLQLRHVAFHDSSINKQSFSILRKLLSSSLPGSHKRQYGSLLGNPAVCPSEQPVEVV